MRLYKHQIEARKQAEGKRAFAYLMGMRTGKTRVVLSEWAKLVKEGELNGLLVISPMGAVYSWLEEIKKVFDNYDDIPDGLITVLWRSGTDNEDVSELLRASTYMGRARPRILLVNVEALSTVEEARSACRRFLNSTRAMLVVDESTTIMNLKAERTDFILQLREHAPYRRILTGLPTPRSPFNLYSQFYFLDPKILNFVSYTAFKQNYADMYKIKVGGGKHRVEVIKRYKNIDQLNGKIAPYSFRVRLEDCSDVPPKLYTTRYVELTEEQDRLYKNLAKHMTTELEDGNNVSYVSVTERVVQILRLHQLCCGHLVDEQGQMHDVPSNRLDALVNLLEEYDGKAVIWCSYAHDLEKICSRLSKEFGDRSTSRFWGGNRESREQESKRFTSDSECRYMVATPGSGARGRDWSVAGMLVYYSNTDNLEHRDQSEERASHTEKTDRVTVVDFITKGTVEEKIVASLRKKIDLAALVVGDKWREWVV